LLGAGAEIALWQDQARCAWPKEHPESGPKSSYISENQLRMHTCVEIPLPGTEADLTDLFSYSKEDQSSKLTSLPEFVAHVFNKETRSYYELERLWSDVASIDWVDPDSPLQAEAVG